MRTFALSATATLAAAQYPGAPGNMNGAYRVASGAQQDVPFATDFSAKGYEYFDIWSPEITTLYGQNMWHDLGNNPVPAEIVKRFKGKAIAVVGYEQDQVMVTPTGQPGAQPEKDVSVPINWAYNHHYVMWLTGEHSEMAYLPGDPTDGTHEAAAGRPTRWRAVDKPSAARRTDTTLPTSQFISEGNGGESRRSFHGYPAGYAQLVDSIDAWHMTPMQIDTRDRKCGVTPADVGKCTDLGAPGYVRPPEPKQARYGRGIPAGGSPYSGVLECPCNSRYGGDPAFYPDAGTKEVAHAFASVASGTCAKDQAVASARDCYDAAATLGFGGRVGAPGAPAQTNTTADTSALPVGCSVAVDGATGAATATYNTASPLAAKAACATGASRSGSHDAAAVGVTLSIRLEADSTGGPPSFQRSGAAKAGVYCKDNKAKGNVLKEFKAAAKGDAAADAAISACEAYCAGEAACTACSVDGPNDPAQWAALKTCEGKPLTYSGTSARAGDISRKLASGGNATITLRGPADAWFGVGLDAALMTDSPYALIVSGDSAATVKIMERQLGTGGTEAEHDGGDLLAPSVTLLSAADAADGTRTVVLRRPFAGKTAKHYTFDAAAPTIKFIAAVGSSQAFAYHKAHTAAVMSLAPTDGSPTCLCDSGSVGQMCDTNGTKCGSFVKNCNTQPGGLEQQHNPTCNSGQYGGGLRCCGDTRIMLDTDQDPGTDLLRYHMKFRIWYQDYTPKDATVPAPAQPAGASASHNDLPRYYWQTEANAGEYDVPPAFAREGETLVGYPGWPEGKPTPGTTCTGSCPDGPDCACQHAITYSWESPGMRLLYAGAHCHAPSCLSMKLYRNGTGTPELVCEMAPVYGGGNVTHDRYDEVGYVELPPCVWGDDAGLEPSFFIPKGEQVFSVKVNNNTHVGHFGEMASWQMRGTPF